MSGVCSYVEAFQLDDIPDEYESAITELLTQIRRTDIYEVVGEYVRACARVCVWRVRCVWYVCAYGVCVCVWCVCGECV